VARAWSRVERQREGTGRYRDGQWNVQIRPHMLGDLHGNNRVDLIAGCPRDVMVEVAWVSGP
jgi:hypothetical protein